MLIIKIGGNILDDPLRLKNFLTDFTKLQGPKLLVHGGGKIASAIGQQLGISPVMVEGRRVTDKETLALVTMVYGGLVNKQVVAQLQALGCNASGMTGADMNSILAEKRPVGEVDYGFAGDIAGPGNVNVAALNLLFQSGITPVYAPLTHDGQGNMLNTNADTIASVLAVALAAQFQVKLVYCFEKKGVLADATDDNSVISHINAAKYTELKKAGIVSAGMVPKLDNAFNALRNGVHQVLIGAAESVLSSQTESSYQGTTLNLNK